MPSSGTSPSARRSRRKTASIAPRRCNGCSSSSTRSSRNIGAAYFWLSLVKGGRDLQTHSLEDWMERGYGALQVMENHLKTNTYFAARQLTVADIALYGYTHLADRCDFDLSTFPAIRDWLERVEAAPGFVTMDWRPADIDDPASIAAGA
ncbi:hypothetical protein ACVJGB_004087 [Bradyrhizobium liaoningense]